MVASVNLVELNYSKVLAGGGKTTQPRITINTTDDTDTTEIINHFNLQRITSRNIARRK
jgi:hypothetical protein